MNISEALDRDSYSSVKDIQDRTHRFWIRGYGFLKSKIGGTDSNIYPEIGDAQKLKKLVESSDIMKADLSREDGYKIDNDKLILTKGKGSYAVDVDKLVRTIS